MIEPKTLPACPTAKRGPATRLDLSPEPTSSEACHSTIGFDLYLATVGPHSALKSTPPPKDLSCYLKPETTPRFSSPGFYSLQPGSLP